MAHGHPAKTISSDDVQLQSSSLISKFPLIGGALAVLGLAGTFVLGGGDPTAMYSSYLVAFLYFLSIGLGALFFVSIFFLTRSGWNVAIRRIAENIMMTLPVFALLFIPIYLGVEHIFHWSDPHALAVDPILQWKASYLNKSAFGIRAIVYFVIWTLLALRFFLLSRKQDATGDHEITRKLQAFGAPAIALGSLTLTFAAFDWAMSLDYHWFSTIFGIYFFSGAMVALFSVMALFTIALRGSGMDGGAITQEHIHGNGKMLFGFVVFWSYIGFSQFFLIWYANIPEETLWFGYRYVGGLRVMSLALIAFHFVVPFFFLMPRASKRNPLTLGIAAVWLLIMHYVDLMWIVKPSIAHAHGEHGITFGIVDVAALLGIGGVMLAVFGIFMSRAAIVAFRDPRLPESMTYENL